jgi:protein TonB
VTPAIEPTQPQPVVQTVERRVVQAVQAVQQVVQREMIQTVQATTPVTTVNQTASVMPQAIQHSETSHTATPTAIASVASPTGEAVVREESLVTAGTAVLQQSATPVMAESKISHQVSEAVVERSAAEQPVETAAARAISTKSIPAAKADYGWLAASLWERIQKDMRDRYPHIARMNRLEGKVLLTVLVRADGSLSDIKIKTSSGHSILDRDAMEFLVSLSPLRLKYPLGKTSQTVEVPISYTLR